MLQRFISNVFFCKYGGTSTFNEPLFNEVLDITNEILRPGQSYSKMYGIKPRYNEPRYNEFFDINEHIRKLKRKIYLDITNYNVNTFNFQQQTNARSTVSKSFNPYDKDKETETFQ